MSGINFNELLQNAKGQLEPIPPGEYGAQVVTSEAKQSSTGKPMIVTKFEVTEGPHAKRKVMTQFVISADSPMALAIFFRQMEALGLPAGFFEQNPTPDDVARNLVNRQCRLTLGVKTWQGVERNEVKGVLPPLGGGPLAPGVATGVPTVLPTAGATPTATPTSVPTPTVPTVPTSVPTAIPTSSTPTPPPLPI